MGLSPDAGGGRLDEGGRTHGFLALGHPWGSQVSPISVPAPPPARALEAALPTRRPQATAGPGRVPAVASGAEVQPAGLPGGVGTRPPQPALGGSPSGRQGPGRGRGLAGGLGGAGAVHVRAGGVPGAGGGAPGSARTRGPSRAGGRREAGVGRWAPRPGRGGLWSQVGGGKRSRSPRDSSCHAGSPAEQRRGRVRAAGGADPFPSASAARAAAAPPPRAQVTSLPRSFSWRGGARVPPASSRLVAAEEASPARGWSSGAGRRPGALPGQLVASPEPGRRPLSRPAAADTRCLCSQPEREFPSAPRFGRGPLSPHRQGRTATRVPAVPGSVVGCRHGNGRCPGAYPGWDGAVKAAQSP